MIVQWVRIKRGIQVTLAVEIEMRTFLDDRY